MFEIDILILVGIAAVLLGIAIGIGLHKCFSSSALSARNMAKELEATRLASRVYKEQVTEHFSESAKLVNDLTKKYKDVHDHLAQGADTLCRDDDGQSLIASTAILKIEEQADTEASLAGTDTPLQPPLDYAPKNNEDQQKGTLAEDYGLEKVSLHENLAEASNIQVPTTDTANNLSPAMEQAQSNPSEKQTPPTISPA